MINRRNPKIFIGLTEIAGFYGNLKRSFDELGIEATFIASGEHRFQYKGEKGNFFTKFLKYAGSKKTSTPRSKILLIIWWSIVRILLKLLLFLWAIAKFDVFVFGFGTSFFRYYDLPIIKALGKKIFYVFHGSDCRPPYINGTKVGQGKDITLDLCISLTRRQKLKLAKIERYTDMIVSFPLYSHFLEKPFVNFLMIGIPCTLPNNRQTPAVLNEQRLIRILHSPSSPGVKGTYLIRQAINALKAKGYPIDYVEIMGKPNTVVIAELEKCDFIVDQLYSDTPMTGFATEAAFFGKPAVVGGYGWREVEKLFSPNQMIPPSLRCHPDNIESSIEQLITDKARRLALGKKAREFVKDNWSFQKVAERFLQLIQGNIPPEWLCDPQNISYLHGGGLSEQRAKQIVARIIETQGKKALQLADKPELEHLFVEFASSVNTDVQKAP